MTDMIENNTAVSFEANLIRGSWVSENNLADVMEIYYSSNKAWNSSGKLNDRFVAPREDLEEKGRIYWLDEKKYIYLF